MNSDSYNNYKKKIEANKNSPLYKLAYDLLRWVKGCEEDIESNQEIIDEYMAENKRLREANKALLDQVKAYRGSLFKKKGGSK